MGSARNNFRTYISAMKLKSLLLPITTLLALMTHQTSAQCPTSGFCLASEHPDGDPSKFPCYRTDTTNVNMFYMCWGTKSWHFDCPPKASGGRLRWDQTKLVCNW